MGKDKYFMGDEKADALLKKVQNGYRKYWGKSSVELLKKWRREEAIALMGA